MPQDAFTLRRVTDELKEKFAGGKISKINMPERDELSLIIYTRTGTVKLEISANPKNNRLSLGKTDKPNPQVAPNFCMLLRKHLQNAEILDVYQIGFERIVCFDFQCFSEFNVSNMTLYCEIMGKYSNVILVEKGVILGAMKQTALDENAKRVLFCGAKYTLPQPQGKADPTDIGQLKQAFAGKSGDAAAFICNAVEGIAYSTALEMVATYGEDITCEQVYDYVNGGESAPCITMKEGEPADFKVRSTDNTAKPYPTLLEAQCDYYTFVYEKKTFAESKRKLSSALNSNVKKLEKRLYQIEQKLSECDAAEETKLKGELITANIYRLERGMTGFKAINYYDENCAEIQIELDRQLSPAQNAQKYYKKYAKLKRTVVALTAQRSETKERLDYLYSIDANISAAECIADLTETAEELTALGFLKKTDEKKKKTDDAAPFRQYEIRGFKILAGRNNVQNDRLLKSLAPDDVWLHVQKYHSCHAGIVSGGKQVPDEVLLVAAQICAYYSEAGERDKVTVDYTPRKNVKKPPKANAGFVIYHEYRSIIVAPNAHQELKNG